MQVAATLDLHLAGTQGFDLLTGFEHDVAFDHRIHAEDRQTAQVISHLNEFVHDLWIDIATGCRFIGGHDRTR